MQIHTKRVPHTEFTYEILDSHNYAVSHTNLTELNHFASKTQDLNANSYKSSANSYKNSSRTEFICEFLDQAPGPNTAPRFTCENCNVQHFFAQMYHFAFNLYQIQRFRTQNPRFSCEFMQIECEFIQSRLPEMNFPPL